MPAPERPASDSTLRPTLRVAHLDMDAFYASVELLRYPELKGQPVVIGGSRDAQPQTLPDGTRRYARLKDYVGRGVITTSTYEARALGVFSAMGMMKAARLAPEAVLLPVDFPTYRHYSRLFKAAVAEIAPLIENRGIDEIYIDLSHIDEATETLARRLKQAVRDATGLSCSIGISHCKLIAKIASDLHKPDGLSIVMADDIPARIWPLAASKINGVGPKATEKLKQLGIATIGELAAQSRDFLIAQFGRSYGAWLHDAAHGIDDRPVVTQSEPKSISRETTFERDLHVRRDRQALTDILVRLCERLADDLQNKRYAGKTIGIKLRYDNFEIATRDHTLPVATADAADILRAARECLKRVPLERRLRLLGVRAGKLGPIDAAAPATAQGELGFD
ncbi:MAG TPA: DNA polymerase IV [Rhodocyclaceae bacterium]|nr:DNA polymerase IV [Rhodocyclaceae bacterium]